MTDPNGEDDSSTETEEADHGGEEYEVERLVTRDEGATVLRLLADGVANGSVELSDEGIVAAIPARFELEIEYEREDEEAELEIELEWPIADGESVAVERDSEAQEGTDGDESERDEGAVTTDSTDDEGDSDAADAPAVEGATDAPVHELVGPGDAASKAEFELYRDRADEWRWRLVHDNGNIIADSGEGYNRKATARKGLESVMRNAPAATVVEREE